ncbi:MAG: SH3 domain-containing protein, partial [Chloroflexia bacterium]|nr:SH3 domain-containing protein [Chloroflexia bacterium]
MGLLCLSLIAPAVTLAESDLAPGEVAVVANTNGDAATLRAEASADAVALTTVPEGSPVQITDGPLTAADGSLWYHVVSDGLAGYISADLLATGDAGDQPADDPTTSDDSTETETETDTGTATGPAASTRPWNDPVAFGVVVNNTATELPPEGIVCRADASAEAPIITELFEGNTLEVTGEETWVAGEAWFPINCAGVGGFVNGEFVALAEPAATEQEQATESEAGTETAVETEQQAVTDDGTEDVASEDAATETTSETEADTSASTEVTTDAATTDEVATESDVSTEEMATDEQITEETVAETTETEDSTTNTDLSSSSDVTSATEAVQPVDTETGTDTTTASDVAAETAPEGNDVSEPEVAVDVEAETEAQSDTSSSGEAATTTTDLAVEAETEGTTEPAAPDVAAEEAARETTTETAIEGPARPASTIDESAAIGSAEVQGTGESGLKCRAAADATAPTITVLAEGTRVLVMAEAEGDWLAIACGGQLGYGDVRFLYSGGAAPADFTADDKGGTVTVSGTGGGGLNCRDDDGMT